MITPLKQSDNQQNSKVRKVSIKGKVIRSTNKVGVPGVKIIFGDKSLTKSFAEPLEAIYTRRDGSFIRIYQENSSATLFQSIIKFNIRLEDSLGKEIYSSEKSWEFKDKLAIVIEVEDNCLKNHLSRVSLWGSDCEAIVSDEARQFIKNTIRILKSNEYMSDKMLKSLTIFPSPSIERFPNAVKDAWRTLEGDLDAAERFQLMLNMLSHKPFLTHTAFDASCLKKEVEKTVNGWFNKTSEVSRKRKGESYYGTVINTESVHILMMAAIRIGHPDEKLIHKYCQVVLEQIYGYSIFHYLYKYARLIRSRDNQEAKYFNGLLDLLGVDLGSGAGPFPSGLMGPPNQSGISDLPGTPGLPEIPRLPGTINPYEIPHLPTLNDLGDHVHLDPCFLEYQNAIKRWDDENEYVITEVNPEMACPGQIISIRGSGFGNYPFEVRFKKRGLGDGQDYIDVEPEIWYDDFITVKVPDEAGCGPISLRIQVATDIICGYAIEIYRKGSTQTGFAGALPDVRTFGILNRRIVTHHDEQKYLVTPGDAITVQWFCLPAPYKYIKVTLELRSGSVILNSITNLPGEGLQEFTIPNYQSTTDLTCKLTATNNCGSVTEEFRLLIHRPAKVSIKGIEVTQVTQFFRSDEHITNANARQPNNSIPLISGKATLARVYFAADPIPGWYGGAENLTVYLFGYRNGQLLQELPLSIKGLTALSNNSVPSQRGQLIRSANFYLPYSWRDSCGSLELFARLSFPENGPDEVAFPYQDQVSGLQFKDAVYSLQVAIVRINYQNGGAPSLDDSISTLESVRRCYPTNKIIDWLPEPDDEVIDFNGSLDTDSGWADLLNKIGDVADDYDDNGLMVWCGILKAGIINSVNNGAFEFIGSSMGVACFRLDFQSTAAHEIGHAWSLDHPVGTDPNQPEDPDFPNYGYADRYSMGEYGVDVEIMEVKDPNTYGEIMSYFNPRNLRWFSPYYYNKLLNLFTNYFIYTTGGSGIFEKESSSMERIEQIFIYGTIKMDTDEVQLEPLYHVPANRRFSFAQPSEFKLVLVGKQGNILYAEPVKKRRYVINNLLRISQSIPYSPKAVALEIRKGDKVLKSVKRPEGSPKLSNLNISKTKTSFKLRWSGRHTNKKRLLYGVAITYNGGKTWRRLIAGASKAEYNVSKKSLLGGHNCLFRVYASDGFNTVYVDSHRFDLPFVPPVIAAVNFKDGDVFPTDKEVLLQVVGISHQSGSLSEKCINWESTDGNFLGNGSSIKVRLKPGTNVINVIVEEATDCIGRRSFRLVGK